MERQFSLDMPDAEASAYVSHLLRDDARKLHSLVASNPLAATRCFHWTVRLVIRTLFNCADKPGNAVDGIPAQCESGVFGHVRAFFGVVEPQMRKAAKVRNDPTRTQRYPITQGGRRAKVRSAGKKCSSSFFRARCNLGSSLENREIA